MLRVFARDRYFLNIVYIVGRMHAPCGPQIKVVRIKVRKKVDGMKVLIFLSLVSAESTGEERRSLLDVSLYQQLRMGGSHLMIS